MKDDPMQRIAAKRLFLSAKSGEIELVTGPPVLFEVAWVMARSYRIERNIILDMLEAITLFPGLTVLDHNLVESAIALARETNSDYVDSYIAASAAKAQADCVATFNEKHFARLGCDLYSF